MSYNPQQMQQEYRKRFEGMGDQELIEAFNHEVGNPGWGSARATYLSELHRAFEGRAFDYSAIGNESGLCLKRKIRLVGKKILIDQDEAARP